MDLVSEHLHLVRPAVLSRMGWLDPETIATGYFALVLAAAEFDPTRGIQFTDYARWRIRNAIVDRLRYEERRKHASLEENEPEAWPDFDIALRLDIQRAIERLPRQQRLLLHLRFWKGLTMAEAAREAGCSMHAAKSAQRAAMVALRAGLA
jgi:RNA polymerase sigma factor (sigma-70 family)